MRMRAGLIGLLATGASALHNSDNICSDQEVIDLFAVMDETNSWCSSVFFGVGAPPSFDGPPEDYVLSQEDICVCLLGLPEETAAATTCALASSANQLDTSYYQCRDFAGVAPPAPPCTIEELHDYAFGEGHGLIKCQGADLEADGDLDLDGLVLRYADFTSAYFYASGDIDMDHGDFRFATFDEAILVAGDDIKMKHANFNTVDMLGTVFQAVDDIMVRDTSIAGVLADYSFWYSENSITFESNYMPAFYAAYSDMISEYGDRTMINSSWDYGSYYIAFVADYALGGIKFYDNFMAFDEFYGSNFYSEVGLYFHYNNMYAVDMFNTDLGADYVIEFYYNDMTYVDLTYTDMESFGGLEYFYMYAVVTPDSYFPLYGGVVEEGAMIGFVLNLLYDTSFYDAEFDSGAIGFSYNYYGTYANFAYTGFFAEYADNPFDNDIGLFYNDFAFTDWEGIEMVAGDWFSTTYDFDLISYDFGYPYKYGGVSLYTDYYDGMVFFRGNDFYAADFYYSEIDAHYRTIAAFDGMTYADLEGAHWEGGENLDFIGVSLYGADLYYATLEATDASIAYGAYTYIMYSYGGATFVDTFSYMDSYYELGDFYLGGGGTIANARVTGASFLGEEHVEFIDLDMYSVDASYIAVGGSEYPPGTISLDISWIAGSFESDVSWEITEGELVICEGEFGDTSCEGVVLADTDSLTLNMYDSWGDGWTGCAMIIGDTTHTIESGSYAAATYYLSDEDYVVVTPPSNFLGFVDVDMSFSSWYGANLEGGPDYTQPSYLSPYYYMYDYSGLFMEPSVNAEFSVWYEATLHSSYGSIALVGDLTDAYFTYTDIDAHDSVKFSYDAWGTTYMLFGDNDGDGFYDTYDSYYGYYNYGVTFADGEAILDLSVFYDAFIGGYTGDILARDISMEYANFHGAEIYGGNEVDFSGSDLHDAYFEDAAFLAGDVIFFDGADLSKSDFDGSVFEVYNYGEVNYDFNYYFEGVDFYSYYYGWYDTYYYYHNFYNYDTVYSYLTYMYYYTNVNLYEYNFYLSLSDVHLDFWDEEGEHYRGIHFHDVNFKGADFEDTAMITPSWIDMSSSNFRKSDFDSAYLYTIASYNIAAAYMINYKYDDLLDGLLDYAYGEEGEANGLIPPDYSFTYDYTYFGCSLPHCDISYMSFEYPFIDPASVVILGTSITAFEHEGAISGYSFDMLYENDATVLFHGSDLKKSSWEDAEVIGATQETVDATIKPSDSFLVAVGPRPPPSPPSPPPASSPPPSPPYMGLMCICDEFRNGADETPYAEVCGLDQGGTNCYPPQADGCGSATACLVAPEGYNGPHFGCQDHLSSKKCSKNVKKGCTSKKAMKKCKSSCGMC